MRTDTSSSIFLRRDKRILTLPVITKGTVPGVCHSHTWEILVAANQNIFWRCGRTVEDRKTLPTIRLVYCHLTAAKLVQFCQQCFAAGGCYPQSWCYSGLTIDPSQEI